MNTVFPRVQRQWTAVMAVFLMTGCAELSERAKDRLPEPLERRVPLPNYTPDQQTRYDEVQVYLAQRYSVYTIQATTQTHIGDIIDWLDPATVPGSQIEPPPPLAPEDFSPAPGAQLQTTELDLSPELRGPAGTIPLTRPRFERYIRGETTAISIEDYVQNFSVGGQPEGQNRLYAGIPFNAANKGARAWMNHFVGDVEIGTFSLMETAVVCRGADEAKTLELIGAVASRDKANFDDAVVRLQVEFFTEGPNVVKAEKGGWDGWVTGFVPMAGRVYGPGLALVPVSTIDGPSYESHFSIQLFDGNWWIAHNQNWLGYYKGASFDLMGTGACEVDYYAEVYDPTPADWTWTDMAGGFFADQGLGRAAYFRNPLYFDASYQPQAPNDALTMTPIDEKCYTRTPLQKGGDGNPYFFVAGPGGDAAGCD